MRVLLAMPNSANDIRDSLGFASAPLGLAYIASYLREFGDHEVVIHDGMLDQTTDKDFGKLLSSIRPDIVGISAQATPAIYDAYRLAELVKEYDPDCSTVVGGAHVSFADDLTLNESPQIDFVARGEGERVMYDLVSELESGRYTEVKGITYRDGSTIKRNPRPPPIKDLDSIPFPAYDLLDMGAYFQGPVRAGTMVSSRGCPYRCTFCSSSRLSGKKWRGRSAENVIEEVELLRKKYKVNEIEFLDDLFSYDSRRVKNICDMMETHAATLRWTCSVRADLLSRNPRMAQWLKRGGCHMVYMGVESGSQRILDLMRKGVSLNQVWRANAIAKHAGLQRIFSFIFGYPTETRKEAESTIALARHLDPELAQFTICTPYPGTPLYKEAEREGWLGARSWRDYSVLAPVMKLSTMSKAQIRKILYEAYLMFYIRPSYLWRQIRSGNLPLLRKMVEAIKAYWLKRSTLGTKEDEVRATVD